MKNFLAFSTLLVCLAGIAVAARAAQDASADGRPQGWHGVLSVDDQSQFDRYYAKWVEATQKNDREDISENARKMQDIMTHYNIPVSVSFDQIASNGSTASYPPPAYATQRLSADDQREFDKYYAKWIEATRKNSQEDIAENERKMRDIMARYSISSDVPFAQVSSLGTAGAYPNGSPYVQPQRLSAHDQHEFDEAYQKWLKARHKKDRDDVDKNERKMHDIMARYSIPANVPYDRIASPGASYR
ncbi:MAG TPA: hypothetical protein VJ453_05370 [Terriglobales bacterium]|jgi:opacity protein-like surface antigen|nr:hypothetical protein [Terriglobales bacterium]